LTGKELGIQENDLWLAAQTVEHNLIFVTANGMVHIKSVTAGMLDVEDWTQPPEPGVRRLNPG